MNILAAVFAVMVSGVAAAEQGTAFKPEGLSGAAISALRNGGPDKQSAIPEASPPRRTDPLTGEADPALCRADPHKKCYRFIAFSFDLFPLLPEEAAKNLQAAGYKVVGTDSVPFITGFGISVEYTVWFDSPLGYNVENYREGFLLGSEAEAKTAMENEVKKIEGDGNILINKPSCIPWNDHAGGTGWLISFDYVKEISGTGSRSRQRGV